LGYFGATFDRLLGGNFHAYLASPLAALTFPPFPSSLSPSWGSGDFPSRKAGVLRVLPQ